MTKPWSDRQREALAAFRQAIVVRAQREREVVEGRQSRETAAEERYAAEKERVDNEYAAAQTNAVTGAEQTRRRLQTKHDEERRAMSKEYRHAKEKILKE